MGTKGERIRDILREENPYAVLVEGVDTALVGIYRGTNDSVGVYSYTSFISALMERDNLSEADAVYELDQQVSTLDVGPQQPLIIDDTGV